MVPCGTQPPYCVTLLISYWLVTHVTKRVEIQSVCCILQKFSAQCGRFFSVFYSKPDQFYFSNEMSSSNQECGDVISDGQDIAHEESMGMEPAVENRENSPGSSSANNKFVFDDWARSNELSRKTTAVLRREECTSQRALSTLTPEEIKELSFPIG